MGSGNEGRRTVGLEIEAVHLRGRVAELERICAAQRDELAGLRGHGGGLTGRERRILDMWPRFGDGVPVMYEDAFRLGGETHTAYGFNFGPRGRVWISDEKWLYVRLPKGERVERPAPEVLDADGVPIRVGDTVWSKDGCEAVVTKVERDRVFTGFEDMFCTPYEPSDLTHREPDSWEKLECDVANASCPDVYCANHHIDSSGASFEWAMAFDIIRRAKLLAGVAE